MKCSYVIVIQRLFLTIPPLHKPDARLSSELTGVRVIYVREILRKPFRKMCGYLRVLSPSLIHHSIINTSYFGPITSYIFHTKSTTSMLTNTLIVISGRVDPNLRPWMPWRKDQQNDATVIQHMEDACCHHIVGEIVSSPNLQVATYLKRHLSPHLVSTLTALVRGSKIGTMHPPRAPAGAG